MQEQESDSLLIENNPTIADIQTIDPCGGMTPDTHGRPHGQRP